MATAQQEIGDTWELVVNAGDEFLVQVPHARHCFFAFDTATPTLSRGHTLYERAGLVRNSIPGNLYAKAPAGESVIISVSAYTPA